MRNGERWRSMPVDLDQAGALGLVDHALEADGLARVGIGAGRLAGRLGVGEVLRDDAQRVDCASRPEAPILSEACSGSSMGAHTFALASSMRWKALATLVLSAIGAIDLAGLDQLLLEADAVAGVRDLPGLLLAHAGRRRIAGAAGHVRGIGRRHRQAGLLDRHLERLDVERLVAGRVGIGDVAGNRRLPHRQPAIVLRDDIEEMNGSHDGCRLACQPHVLGA